MLPIDSSVQMPSCLKLYLKETPTQVLFAVRFTKFFRTPIFTDYLLWLLLVIETLVWQNAEISSNSQENFLDRIRYSYVFEYSKPNVVTKLQVFLRYCFNYVHNLYFKIYFLFTYSSIFSSHVGKNISELQIFFS